MDSSAASGPENQDSKVTVNKPDSINPVKKEDSKEPENSTSFIDTIVGIFKLNETTTVPDNTAKPPEKEIPQIVKDIDKAEFRSSTWFSDYEAMKKNVIYYNEIHPFIYLMKGGLTNTGELSSSWSKTSRHARVAELRSLNPNVKIIPTIFRWENPKEKISENIGMNGRSDIRDQHIKNIIEEVETYGYDGIDIDYEGMTCNKKEKFEEFIVLLSKEMKSRNKILSVAVHPKTSSMKTKESKCKGLSKPIIQDFAENWRGPMTHDYEFLAKHVDRVKIMAYELHPRKYRNPGPGPQAPNVWLKEIVEYALARIPHEKLYMAIPTYGYDWALNCNVKAKAVYYDTALKIKASKSIHYQPTDIRKIFAENSKSKGWKNLSKFMYIHENKVYEDPSLWYSSGGCDRVAFYMNRKAFEDKMTLLRKYNIGGFSFWQLLSDNDPAINDYLSLLVSNKLPPVEKIQFSPKQKIEEENKDLPQQKTDANAKKTTKSLDKTTMIVPKK
ncbi:MAG: hydrolase [Leptospiraceae bacterium]|nr:hydrolase [Leptospiraceae bacterium]